ncbi:Protein kinase-like domain superfamily [Forsythia ovata]|uniref:Protein kinase-like domain superfamily n=1 Tax=Forsythia ovata TaxID=205694 RepID=A0ABD1S4A3_9LAMI
MNGIKACKSLLITEGKLWDGRKKMHQSTSIGREPSDSGDIQQGRSNHSEVDQFSQFLIFNTLPTPQPPPLNNPPSRTPPFVHYFPKSPAPSALVFPIVDPGRSNVIGRGGAGIVYHGKTPNGVEIAVKKL